MWLRAYCGSELLHADGTWQSLSHVLRGYVPSAALSCYVPTARDSHLHMCPVAKCGQLHMYVLCGLHPLQRGTAARRLHFAVTNTRHGATNLPQL